MKEFTAAGKKKGPDPTAREAFVEGFSQGASLYAALMRHPGEDAGNVALLSVRQNRKLVEEHYQTWANQKVKQDWRIGNFVSPKDEDDILYHGWKYGYYKFLVEDVLPSGEQGVECPHGVLKLRVLSRQDVLPKNYLVPADKWVVA